MNAKSEDALVIGCDHLGRSLLEPLKEYLQSQGYQVMDIGGAAETPMDYPDIAEELALRIASKEFSRGILICGTGIGMAIAANKVPGVRAACCHDTYSAERARKSNNAQIITMGALVIGSEVAKQIIHVWLHSEFAGGRSMNKVKKLESLDLKYRK